MTARKRRIVLASTATLIGVAALIFFWALPHYVDRTANALGPGISDGPPVPIPALHADLRIVDLHADTLLWDRDLLRWGTRGHVDLPRLQQGNVALEFFSVVTKSPKNLNYQGNGADTDNITTLAMAERWPIETWGSLSERALYQARRLHAAVAESHGQLRLILSAADLQQFLVDRVKDHELTAGILSIEGSHALEGDLAKLKTLREAGFRMLAPAHLFDNDISGSQQGLQKGGLTDLGRKWVAEMNQQQLIIDLAHVSNVAIYQILELSANPVIISHTGFKGVCESNRNLSDDQMRKIAAKGGIIGVGFWPEVNCGEGLDPIVKSILYGIKVAGIDHIALGSDWDGFVATAIDASRIGWLTGKLVAAGLNETDIRKIMGENALKFLSENLPK